MVFNWSYVVTLLYCRLQYTPDSRKCVCVCVQHIIYRQLPSCCETAAESHGDADNSKYDVMMVYQNRWNDTMAVSVSF